MTVQSQVFATGAIPSRGNSRLATKPHDHLPVRVKTDKEVIRKIISGLEAELPDSPLARVRQLMQTYTRRRDVNLPLGLWANGPAQFLL